MKKIFSLILTTLFLFGLFVPTTFAISLEERSAQIKESSTGTNSVLGRIASNQDAFNSESEVLAEGGQQALIFIKAGEAILIMLRFAGVLLLVVVMYASVLWLTAGGNDTQVTNARKWITNGIIGIIIVSIAHIITAFVIGSAFG